MKEARSKPRYEAPKLTRHGSFGDLTAAQTEGATTDMDFPAGTLEEDLTFSG
jgi:hypothetical protein